jgi:hypothetical protein
MTTEPQESADTQRGGIPADTLANRLMLARAHAGHLSIREAADLCEIGRGAWTNWEKGARPADIIDVATVVADKLGVDRDWLLFGGQLGQAEGRPTRRSSLRQAYVPTTRSVDPLKARPVSSGPFSGGRRDSTRPTSSVPATRRRPQVVSTQRRPKAA